MPLLKQWEIGDTANAAIWKVDEPESFFIEQIGFEIVTNINNEKRRIEHLAGLFLLKYLKSNFPLQLITKDEHGKPRLPNDDYFISISHSYPYVAVVIDTDNEAGIDIQTWHPHIAKIQHKYLSLDEQEMIGTDDKMLTLAWCAKESAYKWHGKKGVEFIEELPIVNFTNAPNYDISIYFKLNKIPQMIFIDNIINNDFACSFIVRIQDWVIY